MLWTATLLLRYIGRKSETFDSVRTTGTIEQDFAAMHTCAAQEHIAAERCSYGPSGQYIATEQPRYWK